MYFSEDVDKLLDEEVKEEIVKIVNNELEILTDEEKQYLLDHSDYVEHHFFYGLHLRNTYIYGNEKIKDIGFFDADELSHIIFDKIIDAIKNSK